MYKLILIFIFPFLLSKAQVNYSDSILILNYYKKNICALANDSMNGRPPSTIYEEKSIAYLKKELKLLKGFYPKIQNFTYKLKDSIKLNKSKNIYCFINNKADSTILMGAHFDHLPVGSNLSLSYHKERNQIHNGADDNASGVALLLGLAKTYPAWRNKTYNYLFVSYSAHEIGLFGSKAFGNLCVTKKIKIKTVFNFDMVGRLDKLAPIINLYGIHTLPETQKKYFMNLNSNSKIYYQESDKVYQSDCKYFAEKGISCLFLSTGIHLDYHKPSDDEENINYNGILLIQKIIENFIAQL